MSKWIYDADYSENLYTSLRSDSRRGISIDKDTLEVADKIISPLIKKGHSIRNICINNMDKIMISEKTVYRYVGLGILSASKFDLKRTVQRKERKKAGPPLLVDKVCRKGRTYADFEKHLEEHEHPCVVQMDTVEGRKGGKVILTLFFCSCNLQLAFLRDSNNSSSVNSTCRKSLNDKSPIDIFETLYGSQALKKLGIIKIETSKINLTSELFKK